MVMMTIRALPIIILVEDGVVFVEDGADRENPS
jgi:hypothetical protein